MKRIFSRAIDDLVNERRSLQQKQGRQNDVTMQNSAILWFLAAAVCCIRLPPTSACQVCGSDTGRVSVGSFLRPHQAGGDPFSGLGLQKHRVPSTATIVGLPREVSSNQKRQTVFLTEQWGTPKSKKDASGIGSDRENESNGDSDEEPEQPTADPASAVMIVSIGFYKKVISPLLPPACRFVPTCSMYGVQAIEQYGPTKGCILIAWRLLRCSPIGGKGYDPPKWPPVPYQYSSY